MTDDIAFVEGPTVWTGPTLEEQAWLVPIDASVLQEIDRLRDHLRARGRTLNTAESNDFRSPILTDWSNLVKRRLHFGSGFLLLRGLQLKGWSEEEAKLVYWGLGSLIGEPRVQNLQGDRVHVVADVPVVSPGQTAPGGSTSNNEILPHTENARPPHPPRLICLMCLNQAPIGGESMLYSGHELHNRLLRYCPSVVPRLYRNFTFGRHAEEYPDGRRSDSAPVFSFRDGALRVRYGRYWINVAEQSLGQAMDPEARAAADTVDAMLRDESLPMRFLLTPGDIVIVNNEVVLHARGAFEDGLAAGERRRLLRLWLD